MPRPKVRRYVVPDRFVLDGKPYRYFQKDLGSDVLIAKDFYNRPVKMSITTVSQEAELVMTLVRVGQLLRVTRAIINRGLKYGEIVPYRFINSHNASYYLTYKQIYDLHDAIVDSARTNKYGRPRTGQLIPKSVLKAHLEGGSMTYIKDDDGNFVPTWEAVKF